MNLKERLKKTFIETIKISEIYPDEKEIISYVKSRLALPGISLQDDSFGNIIVKVAGKGEAVLLSTHLDVPEPNPNVRFTDEGDILRADGSNILGADPKTGLAILIEFIVDLASTPTDSHLPVEVLLTRGEETGLHGATNADYKLLSAKMGLVLDEDGPVTQVVTQAPAFVKIDAIFVGKIVHPREPENGINALQMAAEALTSLPWGYSTEGVTWNVGKFSSGTARNSVPGSATLAAELRSYDTARVVSEMERIKKVFIDTAARFGGRCEFDGKLEFEGYKLERNHPLFERLEKTFAGINLAPNYFDTFGGTDANIFNTKGIRSVPIGSGYYNAHQYTEYASLPDMAQIVDFLNRFVAA